MNTENKEKSQFPRTDAAVIASETDDRLAGELVAADFARSLERELADAKSSISNERRERDDAKIALLNARADLEEERQEHRATLLLAAEARENAEKVQSTTDTVAQIGRDNQAAPEASAVEHPGRGMSEVRILPVSTPSEYELLREYAVTVAGLLERAMGFVKAGLYREKSEPPFIYRTSSLELHDAICEALAKNPGSTPPVAEERGNSSGGAAKPSNTEFQMNSMSYAEARAAVEAFNQYPNLQAILEGRVAGKLIEWPAIRPELKRLALQLAGNTRHEICRSVVALNPCPDCGREMIRIGRDRGGEEFTCAACALESHRQSAHGVCRDSDALDAARWRWWCKWWCDPKDDLEVINDLDYDGNDPASFGAAVDAAIKAEYSQNSSEPK